ncbi:unnamed protein product [Durusdinium trenchii]|uniref:Ubiquitin-like domain-containing protein n=1 Tax=Durusdinium trenchii TaxID=1381693 RepID=A0ABP0L7N5_9DINO
MATNISVWQPSGEVMVLEVRPETTGCELKQQIKERQLWAELTRSTTVVEIIVGDNHLLADDATVLEAGISEDTVVSVVFKPNKVICSNQDAIATLGGIVDSELLLVVEIPDTETQIGECAFDSCKTLAKVIIPNSVTHIEDGAFVGCSALVDLIIPPSVTHIGFGAFHSCTSLTNLAIPDFVTHIGERAFGDCTALACLTIPDSVTHLGDYAFRGCSSLVNLTIPNSMTHIPDGVFEDCSACPSQTL